MKKGLWNRRIPTTLAFIVLLIGIFVTSFLVQTGVIFVGRASPDKTPQNISTSNITDRSFTVTFTTEEKTLAGIVFEEDGKPTFVVYDDRNKKSGQQAEFFSHYITVSDLSPKTLYSFSIISDGKTYLNADESFQVTTGNTLLEIPPKQNPISGRILLPDGAIGQDSIIEIEVTGAQIFTAITRDDGSFIIPTNSLREISLDKYFVLNADQEIKITVRRKDLKTILKTKFSTAASIPTITLAYDYDFSETQEEEISTISSKLKTPPPKATSGAPAILTPKASESFIDQRPLFRGTAVPNQTVAITIESEPIKADIKADVNGTWSFRPQVALSAGEHTITIRTIDSFGILRTISQKFVVFASGSQVAESATPSATPLPTSTPLPTQKPSGAPSPSAAPTFTPTLIPTPTPTLIALLSPTPTQASAPQITPAPPGNSTSLVLTVISVLLIFAGSTLLFLL